MICGQHCGNLAKTILIRTKIADNLFCATVHFIFFSQGVSVLLVTVYEGRKKTIQEHNSFVTVTGIVGMRNLTC
jgi:hypothetical protein